MWCHLFGDAVFLVFLNQTIWNGRKTLPNSQSAPCQPYNWLQKCPQYSNGCTCSALPVSMVWLDENKWPWVHVQPHLSLRDVQGGACHSCVVIVWHALAKKKNLTVVRKRSSAQPVVCQGSQTCSYGQLDHLQHSTWCLLQEPPGFTRERGSVRTCFLWRLWWQLGRATGCCSHFFQMKKKYHFIFHLTKILG